MGVTKNQGKDEHELLVARIARLKQAIGDDRRKNAIAEKAGIPPTSLSNYLGGRDMKVSTLVALADACGVSIEWLATGRGDANGTSSASFPAWSEGFGDSLQKPTSFYTFCLLMATCQEYHLQVRRRPNLAEALAWVAGPYRAGTAAGTISDSLIAETFKDPKKTHPDPWREIDAGN